MDEIIDYVMETPGNTNPNVLRGMLNNSGGNLPPVTSDDNGDVLTVVEGKWAKAAPSGGGGGALVVTGTFDEQTGTMTLDKTWQEIYDAMPLAYVFVEEEVGVDDYFPVISVVYSGHFYFISAVAYGGGEVGVLEFLTDSADGYPTYSPQSGGGGDGVEN